MSYDSTILADSPIRYYKMQESTGTVATDAGSQAQNGTLSGGVTLAQAALAAGLGASMTFNGSTGQISLPTTGLPMGANPFSMEAWLSFSATPHTYNTVVAMGSASNTEWAQVAVKNIPPIMANYGLFGGDTSPAVVSVSTTYHLVYTWDGTTHHLYVNGTQYTGALATPNLVYGSAFIGADAFGDNFTGSISNVALYSTALSSARVSAHYTAGTSSSGVALAGTLAGVGTLSGTLTRATHLADTVHGVGTLSGVLSLQVSLVASMHGVGTLSGRLSLPGESALISGGVWTTRDGQATWKTRDETAIWITRG